MRFAKIPFETYPFLAFVVSTFDVMLDFCRDINFVKYMAENII